MQVLWEETAMVNNFTNINKTNNILSPHITEYEKPHIWLWKSVSRQTINR